MKRAYRLVAWCGLIFCALQHFVNAESSNPPAPLYVEKGFDTLAGDLPPMVLNRKRPYIVISDIYVPPGRKVSIESGCVFLFRGFTALQIVGTLDVKGTADSPVIFTSVNDRTYNPAAPVDAAPYDWNGVYIHEGSVATVMNHIHVLYSVDGISALTKFFRLNEGQFRHNGRSHLMVEGVAHQTGDLPYSYALTRAQASQDGVPLVILKDPLARKRNLMRYVGVSLATGSSALGIISAIHLRGSAGRLGQLSGTDPDNLSVHASSDWRHARDIRNSDLVQTTIGLLGVALGGTSLFLSFSF